MTSSTVDLVLEQQRPPCREGTSCSHVDLDSGSPRRSNLDLDRRAPPTLSLPSSPSPSLADLPLPQPSPEQTKDDLSEAHRDSSAIIASSTVVSFLVLVLAGLLLFFRISRKLRRRHENKRKHEAMLAEAGAQGTTVMAMTRLKRGKARNAFEDLNEWEGVPVRALSATLCDRTQVTYTSSRCRHDTRTFFGAARSLLPPPAMYPRPFVLLLPPLRIIQPLFLSPSRVSTRPSCARRRCMAQTEKGERARARSREATTTRGSERERGEGPSDGARAG